MRWLLAAQRHPFFGFLRDGLRPWLSSLVLLPVCLYVLAHRRDGLFLDSLNVLVHEAGHLCFYFFGDVWYAAGGSIMQVLLPSVLAWHFWQYRSRLGIQVSLLWLGQNALDISIYAADAHTRALALLFNREHDWHYLLTRLGLLNYDRVVAFVCCFVAMLCFIGLLVLPFYMTDDD